VQRRPVERYAGGPQALAQLREQRAVVGEEAALADQHRLTFDEQGRRVDPGDPAPAHPAAVDGRHAHLLALEVAIDVDDVEEMVGSGSLGGLAQHHLTHDALDIPQDHPAKWQPGVDARSGAADVASPDEELVAGDVGIGVNPKPARRIQEADLLIAVGPRLGEMSTGGYTLIDIPTPKQCFVHVHPDPEELGRVYQPELPIVASARAFARAAAALVPIADPPWAKETAAAHEEYLVWRKPLRSPGEIQLGEIMLWLDAQVPADAIFTNGAGNFATWLHRFHQYRRFGTQLAPTSGSMGYGFPAALAAKVVHPERTVICVAGDGEFLMTGQEWATAVQRKRGVIVLIVNNSMYGTIRMHQERRFPGRVVGTALKNPDFLGLARAYGVFGASVSTTEEFAPAFEEAAAGKGPAIIELKMDPEMITTRTTLSEIRREAEARQVQGMEV